MEIGTGNFVSGVTGGYVLRKRHVMAVFSAGKGKYKGQAFVVFKGTASLYDVLTGLNAGIKTSHTGVPVHQGFYYAFDSVLMELRQFVGGLKGVTTIHCVGHSLGGAIATLAAHWIKSKGGLKVNLYTFGSPRVGLNRFARTCTSRLQADNIYRVYHTTDPIPMLPTWPFTHVPDSSLDYQIYSPPSMPPWEHHFIRHYVDSAKINCWDSIKSNRPKTYGQFAIESWLKSDGVVSLTANTLRLLDASLVYVLRHIGNALGIITIGAFSAHLTLLDRLAMILKKAIDVSVDVSVWVYRLIRKMARLVGITVKKGMDLTVHFIRTVFIRLHTRIAEMVRRVGMVLS
jgi:triacylglycerol lipase